MINVPRYKHLIVTAILVITFVNIYQNQTLQVNLYQKQTSKNPLRKLRHTSLFLPLKSKNFTKNNNPKPKKLKRILYWNASKKFGFCCGRVPYKKHECLSSLCHISVGRQENLETFDAIIFNGRFLDPQDIPAIRYNLV